MMTKVFNFPTVPVAKQLFHVPGGAIEGGYTSGAVRVLSPEPGGRSVLEMEIALQVNEWENPYASWLMSKGNGEVFRIRLAPTPQVLSAKSPWNEQTSGVLWSPDTLWSNQQPWSGDIVASFASASLEGANIAYINMSGYGDIAKAGHVIGHRDATYIIDEIEYNAETSVAKVTVKPPLRANIAVSDNAYFRPFFTGTIGNIGEVRATYDSSNAGHIQPGMFLFSEAII